MRDNSNIFDPQTLSEEIVKFIGINIQLEYDLSFKAPILEIKQDLDNIKEEKLEEINQKLGSICSSLKKALLQDNKYLFTRTLIFIGQLIPLVENYTYYGKAKKEAISQLSKLLQSSLKEEQVAAPCVTPYVGKKVSSNNRII